MKEIIKTDDIQNRIFTIRGVQVMLDKDLAEIYQIETKVLNQAVKRNIERFPDDFMFQLAKHEVDSFLRSQFVTLETGKYSKYLPYAFTEQGVSMLSTVLRSKVAIEVSINIIRAFAKMRKFIENNANVFSRLYNIEQKQKTTDAKQLETDNKINTILKALEDKTLKPKQGIFYDGQIFDAYVFVAGLIKTATKSISLIDNYIDESVLQLFTKRNKNVCVNIYTKNISKVFNQDIEKHNQQYPKIKIEKFTKAHDRFLIIDEHTIYHFGASLKDLGKKWFAFSKMDIEAIEMLNNLKKEINNGEITKQNSY